MLGVNSWFHEPGELKAVMTKEKINWRTFDDEGEVNRQWNFPATPAFFIIDHEGTIRRKWVGKPGEKSVEDALKNAIDEAEKAAASK
jgi:peroxiredoxin